MPYNCNAMELIPTKIDGLFILEPKVFGDARGYFFEAYNKSVFEQLTGLQTDFVQDNESCSHYGVLRGLHFQKGEHAQAKLVRVVSGEVLDVAVDLRPGSKTFGQHVAVRLSGENHRMLYIPRGFAHGFSVLSELVIFQYKCDNLYCPSAEGAIAWNDPDLGIDWGLPVEDVVLSDKDRNHPSFKDFVASL